MSAVKSPVGAEPYPGLLRWLRAHDVEHEVHEHQTTITARATARAEGIDPRRFAKCVGIATADGSVVMAVVDAADRLDLRKASVVLSTDLVRLLSEAELLTVAPECEIGTWPPIDELVGARIVADFAVREDPEISFHAGSHRFTVHVDRAAWERESHVTYGDLAERDDQPAWARS
jgi:Ala-tRNA(Pro) deacylase